MEKLPFADGKERKPLTFAFVIQVIIQNFLAVWMLFVVFKFYLHLTDVANFCQRLHIPFAVMLLGIGILFGGNIMVGINCIGFSRLSAKVHGILFIVLGGLTGYAFFLDAGPVLTACGTCAAVPHSLEDIEDWSRFESVAALWLTATVFLVFCRCFDPKKNEKKLMTA